MNHWFHHEARAEFLASVRHYESQQPGLGCRFLAAATEAIHRIEAYPEMHPTVWGSWRQSRICRFPYGIIYRIANHRIEIIAVMHLHRRPGYWRDRSPTR